MPFTLKTSYLITDGIIELYEGDTFKSILLIERKNDPKGLALPGGFVDVDESVEDALRLEDARGDELGCTDEQTAWRQIVVRKEYSVLIYSTEYSDPNRDPRFHAASVVFAAQGQGQPKGGDDGKDAKLYALEEIPMEQLVFDHSDILKDYLLQHYTNKVKVSFAK